MKTKALFTGLGTLALAFMLGGVTMSGPACSAEGDIIFDTGSSDTVAISAGDMNCAELTLNPNDIDVPDVPAGFVRLGSSDVLLVGGNQNGWYFRGSTVDTLERDPTEGACGSVPCPRIHQGGDDHEAKNYDWRMWPSSIKWMTDSSNALAYDPDIDSPSGGNELWGFFHHEYHGYNQIYPSTYCQTKNDPTTGFRRCWYAATLAGEITKNTTTGDITETNFASPTSGSPTGHRYIKASPPLEYLNYSTVTITIASPAVVSLASHGRADGDTVVFSTDGALPTGILAGTTYYVSATGKTSGAFRIAATYDGAINGGSGAHIATSGSQSGTHKIEFENYPLRTGTGNPKVIWGYHDTNDSTRRFYMLYTSVNQNSGGHVARQCLSRKGLNNNNHNWDGWSSGTTFDKDFGSPYSNSYDYPRSSGDCNSVVDGPMLSVKWSVSQNKYYGVFWREKAGDPTRQEFYTRTSSDLITWNAISVFWELDTPREAGKKCAVGYAYPSFIDPNASDPNFDKIEDDGGNGTDDEFRLYLSRFKYDSKNGNCFSDNARRDLVYRTIKIDD